MTHDADGEPDRPHSQSSAVQVVPPGVSLRRSRIGWWAPVFGMPVLLALSALLAGTKAAPPGIGIIAFSWGLLQAVWIGGPTVTRRWQLPQVDQERMLMTGRNWTGRRTLNLARLSRVQRVKWTFRGQYGTTDRVDYVILTDEAGVRLSMPRWAATEPVQLALSRPREQGLPGVRISRFAAMGLGLAPDDMRFHLTRTVILMSGLVVYAALVSVLIVKGIPALAGYHGG